MTKKEGDISPYRDALLKSKLCARKGCCMPVKKATAKYCSIQCCNADPVRHEKIRKQLKSCHRVIPFSRQLSFNLSYSSFNPEEILKCDGKREDVPTGLSRLVG